MRLLVLALFLFAAGASAQQPRPTDWDELPSLVDGKRITVSLTDGSTVRGKARDITTDGLSVGGRSVTRSDVSVISYRARRGGMPWRGVGGLLGATAGIPLGYTLGSRFDNEGANNAKTVTVVSTMGALAVAGHFLGRGADSRRVLLNVRNTTATRSPRPGS